MYERTIENSCLNTPSLRGVGARRRRVRVLRHLLGTTHGRAESKLVSLFGTHVHGVLKELFLANLIEADLGERRRWRLTMAGRVAAQLFLGKAAA
jgi:hypothetical protein